MTIQVLKCAQRLVWLELQLGRVFSALAWIEFAAIAANQLVLDDKQSAEFIEERESQDLILGLLLLKTELWELKWVDFLPNIIGRLGFGTFRMALLYALGYENTLRSEKLVPDNDSEDSIKEVFADWIKLTGNQDLPARPEFSRSKTVRLSSFVLGCEVIVEAENTSTSIDLAETILSALEAFLATSLDNQLFPYRSELHILVKVSDQFHGTPQYQINETDSEHTVIVHHNSVQRKFAREEQEAFRSWLLDLILKLTFLLGTVDDSDAFLKQVVEDERGTSRALEYSDVAVVINNIFGQTPKFKLSDWLDGFAMERFPLKRTIAWNQGQDDEHHNQNHEFDWKPGAGEAPEGLFGVDNLKHKERRVFSLINMPLWDKANWGATAYIYVPKSIPMLILGFGDADAAKRIFEEWQRKLGENDQEEQLRVSIVTEISRRHPSYYKVLISINPTPKKTAGKNQFILVSRLNLMTPPDLSNLNSFIDRYKNAGCYYLLPAHYTSEREIEEPIWDLRILKKKINIRPAWQIGENDPDVVTIREDDDPIIPEGTQDVPVLGAMQRFKKRRNR